MNNSTQYQEILKIATQGKRFHNISRQIEQVVESSGIQTGMCYLFLRHTSASLVIQENADPDVLVDLERFMGKIVPEGHQHYRHATEGLDDMPAHIRTALTHTSEQIPVGQGSLLLGTWQGVYLWEHRSHGSNRQLVVHVVGDSR
ncbi:MAG: YjbQ family protein [SAR324 cluster bacterium]|nr:YjbQ family protein [SAR324 cluster bacterium]